MSRYVFGVDVGGTAIKFGLFNTEGELLEKQSVPTDTAQGGVRILPAVAETIKSMLAQRNLTAEALDGVGMGLPGPVDGAGIVHGCINLGWGTVDAAGKLRDLLGGKVKVVAANDANAAALGELRFGGGKGYASAVVVTLGTGVGGGIVMGNGVLPGTNGAAGELSHMTVDPTETEKCACGKCGCLEQYASARGIVRVAKRLMARSDTPSALRSMDEFTSVEICKLASEGDDVCVAALDVCAEAIGRALSFTACVVDPEVFILGGGMSRAGDVLFEPVRAYYRKYAFTPSRETPIIPAELGNDAGIFGCAALILN